MAGPYRDELAAAHARIRELEEKLAASERPAVELAADWLASLHAERARVIAGAKKRPGIVAFAIPATMSGLALLRVVSAPPVVAIRVVAPLLFLAMVTLWIFARSWQARSRADPAARRLG